MKNKWLWIGIIVISIFILGAGGKKYMEKHIAKKNLEKNYQQGAKIIQTYVSEYLVENYVGIKKIKWLGVGVEWRSSPIYGSSMLGNYVDSDVEIYVSEDVYFTMRYTLTDEVEYDYDQKKYISKKGLNPENTDLVLEVGKENAMDNFTEEEQKLLDMIRENTSGSPKADVIENLKIHELTY